MVLPLYILTRPLPQSQELAAQLAALGVDDDQIIISPVLEIVGAGVQAELDADEVAVFTSANALAFWNGTPGQAYCVGARTAQAARDVGFKVLGTFADLADLQANLPKRRLHHFRGEHITGQIAGAKETILYHQNPLPLTPQAKNAFKGGTDVVLPLFSRRTAKILCGEHDDWGRHTAIVISPAVAEICQAAGFQSIWVAKAPNAAALVNLIRNLM